MRSSLSEDLRQAIRATLRRHGVRIKITRRRDAEAWRLQAPPHPATLFLPTVLGAEDEPRIGSGAQGPPRLWMAHHVPPVVANRLVAGGETFVDGTGNVNLTLPGLVVRVLGNRPTRTARTRREERPPRAWRRPAIRILFRLLCEPALGGRPIRDIAEAAGTAVGTVVHLLQDLERTGNVVPLDGRRRRFLADQPLVTRWMMEYEQKLRPHLLLGRFTSEAALESLDLTTHGALWGGEPAARLLGADLLPGIWTIYAAKKDPALLRAAGLRPDPDGEVELRRAFWVGDVEAPRRDVTHPLLVVADLLATRDGRCHAAAHAIEREHLRGLLERS
jgi:hypothetical protein